ncbi:MAG: type II secretion system F family protein [Paludisphaera borealis]|uniref:type II secretion system F family protein n=1 Tax=Paludisphaera borealis TaxID=1387353 RepID=UPI00283DC691|nr:type II secretion system F family protein [Paludisphaera borealis]MDR3622205.1 type II secretion system F family protein [Paludisphaera borealis]
MSEASSAGSGARPVTIDQLIALNEEIVALVRSGSPLERGLVKAGEDLPGRLGAVTKILADRMGRGEDLVSALEAEKAAIPPLYRAVVEAGSRTGDLASALQGLTRYLRGYSETRAAIGLALWYPLLVVTLAYGLFIGVVTQLVPRFREAFEQFDLPATRALSFVERVGELAPYWWPIWPIMLCWMAFAWWRSGRAVQFSESGWTFLSFFPWMRPMLKDHQSAGFAELLALLLENKVAYPEAVSLAAEATGSTPLINEAHALSKNLEQGRPAGEALRGAPGPAFSPLLRWVLTSDQQQGSIVEALRNLAPMYRKRAAYRAEKLRLFLPSIVMILVGASATLLYALTLFLPLTGMLNRLAGP